MILIRKIDSRNIEVNGEIYPPIFLSKSNGNIVTIFQGITPYPDKSITWDIPYGQLVIDQGEGEQVSPASAYEAVAELNQFIGNFINASSGGGGGGSTDIPDSTSVIFVSKQGDDDNDGRAIIKAKLTINAAITAAKALSTAGAVVEVIDSGVYSEIVNCQDNISVDASYATLVGRVNLRNNMKFRIGKHFPASDGQIMVYKDGTSYSYYQAIISDGRGVSGNLTGTINIHNVTSSSITFADIELMYVSSNGRGIREASSGTGHIHFRLKDLYLAANGAVAIDANGAASNLIGYIDHILEIGSPTNTTAIRVTGDLSVVRVTLNQIIADTAYNVTSGNLYITCPDECIVGIRTGEVSGGNIKIKEDLELKADKENTWYGTQEEYDAISEKDPNVEYNIEEE